jgi:hypothetical protein
MGSEQKKINQRGLMIRGRRVESPNRIRPEHDFVLDHQALTKEDSHFWVRELAASSPIGGKNDNDGADKCSPPSPFDNNSTKRSIHLVMSLDKGDFSDKFIAGVHAQAARIGGGRDCYYCRR